MLLQKYRIPHRPACGNLNRIGLRYLSTYSRYVSVITNSRNVKLQEAMTICCRARRSLKKKGPIEIDEFASVHRPKGIRARARIRRKSRADVVMRI